MRALVRKIGSLQSRVKSEPSVSETNVESCTKSHKEPLFYIHIPKTAGTSFKKAACDYYGDSKVLMNYGERSIETSFRVKKIIKSDHFVSDLDGIISSSECDIYLGHVHAQTARHVFYATNIFTFLRNPLEQVLSHYNHYKRWYSYDGSLDEFVTTAGFQNVQSKYLNGMPVYLMGLVGITEKYAESIELYNQIYHADIQVRNDNVNETRAIDSVDEETLSLIKQANVEDFKLYSLAEDMLEKRLEFYRNNKTWCFGGVHRYNAEKNVIFGVAFHLNTSVPAEVDLVVDGEVIDSTIANQFRPGFAHWNVPNFNHIGFQFTVPKGRYPYEFKVIVSTTGQRLYSYF